MAKIILYTTINGDCPIEDYLNELAKNHDKDSCIRMSKIRTYVKILEQSNVPPSMPVCKHLYGKLFELHPPKDRVFFVAWVDKSYVLLHCYEKKSQKAPQSELDRAEREMRDFMERWNKNG